MSASFKIEGMSELRSWLATMPRDIRDDGRIITRTAAQAAYDETYANLPVVTGYLRSQLRVVTGTPGPTEAEDRLINRAPYAHLVEMGTHNQRARPVFYPAWHRQLVRMWAALAAMVASKGFTVTGSADV